VDASETTEIGCTRRLRRIALIAMVNLTIRAVVTLASYVIAFVIVSPMLG
jgi:hypothetical protein